MDWEASRNVEENKKGDISNSTEMEFSVNENIPSNAHISLELASLLLDSSDEEESVNRPEESSQPVCQKSTAGSNRTNRGIHEDNDEIILSLIYWNAHIGAAYYNIVTSELFVMEDTMDDVEYFDVTRALYEQCLPHYVLINSSTSVAFLNAIKKLATSNKSSEDSFSTNSTINAHSASLKTMSKKEHNFDRCSHRVRCLRLENEPKNASSTDRLTFLNSILNFKCHAMIHALGTLLLFLDKNWSSIALDRLGRPRFFSLSYVTLQDLVMIDKDTYTALNIIEIKDHPSLFKFGKTVTNSRGISLFSLLNRYCQSRPGVQFLWNTLHHPTKNLSLLEERLNLVEFFFETDNQNIVENLSSHLRQIYRLTTTILACCSGLQAKVSNWYKLHKTVSHIIFVADICEDCKDKVGLLKRIAESVTTDMQYIKYFIEYIIDFDESKRHGTLKVKSNVDPLLDELNHIKRNLPERLTKMAEKDMRESLPPSVSGCNMLYLPNIGYVLAVNKWNPTPSEDTNFPGLEYKFSINQVHYYKSSSARELDETVGDIVMKIAIRQNHIMQKLARYAKMHMASILEATRLCGELDTLLAFHKLARDCNYTRPTLTNSNIIDVKEGRHPLVECTTTFVPNDISCGDNKSLIKVLTGPNSCGKSVYLKEIGLIIFMAHIGSYVPAKTATIGTVSRIVTQMLNTESVGLNSSSFLQNLRQINVALHACRSDSIVLTDELDSGTSEISGIPIAAAVLNTFAERGNQCPRVFAATHGYNVLQLLHDTPLIEIQTFEYTTNEDESLTFLYRLTSGSAEQSYAHYVAKLAGLDENIVERGLAIFEHVKKHEVPTNNDVSLATFRRIVEQCGNEQDFDLNNLKLLVREIIKRQ